MMPAMGTKRKSRCAPRQSAFEISQSIRASADNCATRDNILLVIFELFYGRNDRVGFTWTGEIDERHSRIQMPNTYSGFVIAAGQLNAKAATHRPTPCRSVVHRDTG